MTRPEVAKRTKEAAWMERMYFAARDMGIARGFVDQMLKHQLHFSPMQSRRRWTTYDKQTAYFTALVVTYSRPFVTCKPWPKLTDVPTITGYKAAEMKLHERLLGMRHSMVAHTQFRDGQHSARPSPLRLTKGDDYVTIVMAPEFRLVEQDLLTLRAMVVKAGNAFRAERDASARRLLTLEKAGAKPAFSSTEH